MNVFIVVLIEINSNICIDLFYIFYYLLYMYTYYIIADGLGTRSAGKNHTEIYTQKVKTSNPTRCAPVPMLYQFCMRSRRDIPHHTLNKSTVTHTNILLIKEKPDLGVMFRDGYRRLPGDCREAAGGLQEAAGSMQEIAGRLQDVAGWLQEVAGRLQETAGRLH